MLSDEDQEQDPDRWVSRTPCGQDCWQIISQWVWNLRLELGQHLTPFAMRITEFSPAQSAEPAAVVAPTPVVESAPVVELEPTPVVEPISYGLPQWARRSWTSGFAGSDFVLQPDGTLRCPAGHPLTLHERRPERNGSVRMVYGARSCHCRPCPLRAQCQESATTIKPRQVSALIWPLSSDAPASPAPPLNEAPLILPEPLPAPQPAPFPVLCGDWPRWSLRRQWLQLLRSQTVILPSEALQLQKKKDSKAPERQTRAQRAHWRLSWDERLARNTCPSTDTVLKVTIHALPATFAHLLGLAIISLRISWDLDEQRMCSLVERSPKKGLLVLDEVGLPKQGKSLVGVQHHYCRALGKQGNCQGVASAEFVVDNPSTSRPFFGPKIARLYLSERWTEDRTRCQRCHVAQTVTFATKPELALQLVDQART